MDKICSLVFKGNEKIWIIPISVHPSLIPFYKEQEFPIAYISFMSRLQQLKFRLFPSGKLFSIDVGGKDEKTYSFLTHLTKDVANQLINDGVEIDEIVNVIPVWVAEMGLVRIWCFIQDIFNFNNPFIDKSKLL